MKNKITEIEELKKIVTDYKDNKKTIVFTNGCFDILHIGHIRYLDKASSFGDKLIIGINSNKSVKIIKNSQRPIIDEKERAEIISALEMIDHVVIFDEPTCSSLLRTLKPDIYVKGGDYTPDTLPEWPVVQEYGGQVEFVDLIEGKSTTDIINKIKEV